MANWRAVTNWTDVGWDTYDERTHPTTFLTYTGQLTAHASSLTVYVRIWKKSGVADEEIDVNFDRISLVGHTPYAHPIGQPGAAQLAVQAPKDGYDAFPAPPMHEEPGCGSRCGGRLTPVAYAYPAWPTTLVNVGCGPDCSGQSHVR